VAILNDFVCDSGLEAGDNFPRSGEGSDTTTLFVYSGDLESSVVEAMVKRLHFFTKDDSVESRGQNRSYVARGLKSGGQ
jgi:hypothetical protein